MNLHKNKQEFYDTILFISDKLNIPPAIIEKDYYVTLFLESLAKKVPNLLFKGGTSLSKCYKIINRFSEDIDLTLINLTQTQKNKRNLKYEILKVCNELGLEVMNKDSIRSRRDYNKYEINYPIRFEGDGIKQHLLVETVFMVKSYPDETRMVTSIIFDFFKNINDLETIKTYDIKPFEMHVQTLERTLIDKVFAICDYAITNNIEGHSRHIYDLYKLLGKVELDDSIKKLIKEVREDRKLSKRCFSAQDGYDIPYMLNKIINERIYYQDYIKVTEKVLYDNTTYDVAIKAVSMIIESKVF